MTVLPPPPDSLLAEAALFLDFDGTLVELADTPDAIRVSPALAPMLERLRRRLDGRLAIVSGRSLEDLKRHVPLHDIAFSGSHGLELQLADGTHLPLSVPIGLDDTRAAIEAFAAETKGLLVEEKPASIALHYRGAPDAAAHVTAFMTALAKTRGFTLQAGQMVIELRPDGANKGDAVKAFMTDPAFAGATPVFVGDDLTDEHGFAAVDCHGGFGVLVGARQPSAARYGLHDPAAVREWLEQAVILSQMQEPG